MSVGGQHAEALIKLVLALLEPQLPPDTELRIRGRRLISVRADRTGGSMNLISVRRFGSTWLPWVPRSVAARWTAIDAVEKVLDAARGLSDANIASATTSGTKIIVTYPAANGEPATVAIPTSACR